MELSILPDDVSVEPNNGERSNPAPVSIIPYESYTAILKEKSRLRQNMISLLMEGEKKINVEGSVIHTNPDSVLLLGSGNYLFTERLSIHAKVKSIMFFFDDELMPELENGRQAAWAVHPVQPASYVIFPKDNYVWQFMASVQTLLNDPESLTDTMKAIKLTELLVYLGTTHPAIFAAFKNRRSIKPDEQLVKQTVEANVANNLSLDELAFLCNMSLATFKRKFASLYNTSPAKWLQTQRLEAAARLLTQKNSKPAELYLQAGYENHSSFSQAFKAHFGVSPKAYTLQKTVKN